jgi:membrane peptidoglycan carboxypeptidase
VIDRIEDRNGKPLSVPAPKCKQAVSRNVADAAAAILTNVVDGGISGRTGGAMSLGRDTTGKTGTINDNAAVWFAGSTPDLAAAVMLYDPRSATRHPLKNLTINGRYYSQVFGSSIPGPTWKAAMLGALKGRTPVPMELSNEWGLKPARQVGTPSQDWSTYSGYRETEVPWWRRGYGLPEPQPVQPQPQPVNPDPAQGLDQGQEPAPNQP